MYACMFGSKRIKKMAKENVEKVNRNDFSMMMVFLEEKGFNFFIF